jgi:hypothetical protein
VPLTPRDYLYLEASAAPRPAPVSDAPLPVVGWSAPPGALRLLVTVGGRRREAVLTLGEGEALRLIAALAASAAPHRNAQKPRDGTGTERT